MLNIKDWLFNEAMEIKNKNGNIRILNIQYSDKVISFFYEEQKTKQSDSDKKTELERIRMIVGDLAVLIYDTFGESFQLRPVAIDFDHEEGHEDVMAHSFLVVAHTQNVTAQEHREAQKLMELYEQAGERFQQGEGVPFPDGMERLYGVYTPSKGGSTK